MIKIRHFCCNPYEERAYLISDGTGAGAVIDPGFLGEAETAAFDACLSEQGIRLEAVLLTHAHFDHVYAVKALQDRFGGIPVYLYPDDARQLRFCSVVPRMMGFPEPDTDFTRTDLAEGPLSVAGMAFEVIATPGHSPGSVCYLEREAGILFSGDTLFAGSIGRSDLPGGEYDDLIRSILEKQ